MFHEEGFRIEILFQWRDDMKKETSHSIQHYMTSQWPRWRLKSPASRLFAQSFIRAQIKENIKAPRHLPLCGKFTGDRWIPRTNGQYRWKYFHLMTSSWNYSSQIGFIMRAVADLCHNFQITFHIHCLFSNASSAMSHSNFHVIHK